MVINDSDYTKDHIDMVELLPSVLRSEVNKAVVHNLFNRYVTKRDMTHVHGIASSVPSESKIPESSLERQLYQLQPLLSHDNGDETNVYSFYDAMRELKAQGVDTDSFDDWGQLRSFNFIPPVDIDKLVNYSNYYWVDDSTPQYITIQNRLTQICFVLRTVYSQIPELVPIIDQYLNETDPLIKESLATDAEELFEGIILLVEEKKFIQEHDPLNYTNTDGWNEFSWDPLYETNWDDPIDGFEVVNATDSYIDVAGNKAPIFNINPSFTFAWTGSVDNDGIYEVAVAQYLIDDDITRVYITGTVTNPQDYTGKLEVGPYGEAEWDPLIQSNWDWLNPNSIFDPNDIDNPYNFLLQTDPWSKNNYWLHVDELPSGVNVALLQQAQRPILEYDYDIQLNSWSYTKHNWKYSKNGQMFDSVEVAPTDQELFSYQHTFNLSSLNVSTRVVDVDLNAYPNAATELSVGSSVTVEFLLTSSFDYFEISNIVINGSVMSLQVVEPFPVGASNLNTRISSIRYSSLGDDWKGFFNHWVYDGQSTPVPIDSQQLNSNLIYGSPDYLNQTYTTNGLGTSVNWYQLGGLEFRPGAGEIRVYVNGVRQYGTYIEGFFDGINYTTNIPVGENGNAIFFIDNIGYGQLRVDVGPAAASDVDYTSVQVRVGTSGFNVENVSLVEYKLIEQSFNDGATYPLFDMFNVLGESVNQATPLWSYQYDSTSGIDPYIRLRVANSSGNIHFFQHTVTEDLKIRLYKKYDRESAEFKLVSVWKTSEDSVYQPSKIDADYDDVNLTDDSIWKLPDPFNFNLEHKNKQVFGYHEIATHFNSIISEQQDPMNLSLPNGIRWRVLLSPEYGKGGTIKEYDKSLDTFMSTVFNNNVTIPSLLKFASDAYDNAITKVRSLFVETLLDNIGQTSYNHITNIQSIISETVLHQFSKDEWYNMVFGDSNTSNGDTGINGFPPTVAFLNMMPKKEPIHYFDPELNINQIKSHIGHLINATISGKLRNDIKQRILDKANTSSGTLLSRPVLSDVQQGHLFYAVDELTWYKVNVEFYTNVQPIPKSVGDKWFNTSNNTLYEYNGSIFSVIPDEDGWEVVDLDFIYGEVLLQVETELYDAAPETSTHNVIDIEQHSNVYNYKLDNFKQFINEYNLTDYREGIFNASDPFTWNYKSVDVSDYDITVGNIPLTWNSVSPAAWYTIYQDLYGTRYPHLEPWVLQNYSTKPSWWDYEYSGTNRRWTQRMWENIMAGEVPEGYEYPSGEVSNGVYGDPNFIPNEGITIGGTSRYECVSVNVTDSVTTDGLYGPDDLMPPYYNSTDQLDNDIIQFGSLLITPVPAQEADDVFEFGDIGALEDVWMTSITYPYTLAIINYFLDPITFVHNTFGTNFTYVENMPLDLDLDRIHSHRDTVFHGELLNNNVHKSAGLNQLYVLFHRYNGIDVNYSSMKDMWRDWELQVGYQTASFVDEGTIFIKTTSNILTDVDHEVLIKRTPSIKTIEIDGLNIWTYQVGEFEFKNGVQVPIDKGSDWVFALSANNRSRGTIKIKSVDVNQSPTTFNIMSKRVASDVFNHYPIQDDQLEYVVGDPISSLGPEYTGIQGLINFIDGYKAALGEKGVLDIAKTEYTSVDPATNRTNGWQLETELLVEQIYKGAFTKQIPRNFLGVYNTVSIESGDDTFRVIGLNDVALINDMPVQVESSWILPEPFNANTVYYVSDVDYALKTFKLKATVTSSPIVAGTSGQGYMTVGTKKTPVEIQKQQYEFNPFGDIIVLNNPVGILADVNRGSYNELKDNLGVYDQYGRSMEDDDINVFRRDQLTVIMLNENIPNKFNDALPIKFGGAKLYVDGLEHVIMMNNVTSHGTIFFDQLLGVHTNRILIDVEMGARNLYRPSIGGKILANNKLVNNFDSAADNIEHMFDAYNAQDNDKLISAARSNIGFEDMQYLTDIGVSTKAQLQFYRGLIQHKGSVNAVNAFINHRKFVDANVDEFWAYKVGEYGSVDDVTEPTLHVKPTDFFADTLNYNFAGESSSDRYVQINKGDRQRWVNLPSLSSDFIQHGMYFDSLVSSHIQNVDINNIIHHDRCDVVRVVVNIEPKEYVIPHTGSEYITVPQYITDTNMIHVEVERNGATIDATFEEIDDSEIRITSVGNGSLESGDMVRVNVQSFELSSEYFERLNNELLSIHLPINIHESVDVYLIKPDIDRHDPIELLDSTQTNTLNRIKHWNPREGDHYYLAEQHVDIRATADPAQYTDSLASDTVNPLYAWNDLQLHKTWIDERFVDYVPYNDPVLMSSEDDIIRNWGRHSFWSKHVMRTWVESNVHPEEYDNIGSPYKKLFKRTRSSQPEYVLNVDSIGGNTVFSTLLIEPVPNDSIIQVKLVNGTNLPRGLDSSEAYYLEYVDQFNTKFILKRESGTVVKVEDTGSGTFSFRLDEFVNPFDDNWNEEPVEIIKLFPATYAQEYPTGLDLSPYSHREIVMYVNGEFYDNIQDDVFILPNGLNPGDYVTLVISEYTPSDDELEFNPDIEDDTDILVQYKYGYDYSTVVDVDTSTGEEYTKYYFWVEGSDIIFDQYSTPNIEKDLLVNPEPFWFTSRVIVDDTKVRFVDLNIKNMSHRPSLDDSFFLKLVIDGSLRDGTLSGIESFNRKNPYEEWELIREQQTTKIPRVLWDKLVSSLSGRIVENGVTTIVPFLDYKLQDETNNTSYQYGLGRGQVMLPKSRGLQIIDGILNDSNINFYPIDINEFINMSDFGSADGIESMMEIIYNTFNVGVVNKIWFTILREGLTYNSNFSNIFKTSWVQLYGVRLFDVTDPLL